MSILVTFGDLPPLARNLERSEAKGRSQEIEHKAGTPYSVSMICKNYKDTMLKSMYLIKMISKLNIFE